MRLCRGSASLRAKSWSQPCSRSFTPYESSRRLREPVHLVVRAQLEPALSARQVEVRRVKAEARVREAPVEGGTEIPLKGVLGVGECNARMRRHEELEALVDAPDAEPSPDAPRLGCV